MTARVHDVEAGRDDTDHEPAGVERAHVRGGVDPDREPAHDGDAGAGEEPAELARVGQPVRCRRTRPDDCDAARLERVGPVAFAQQHRRPVGEWIANRIAVVVGDPDARYTLRFELRPHGIEIVASLSLTRARADRDPRTDR